MLLLLANALGKKAIIAARCRGIFATGPCMRFTRIFAHLSSKAWRNSPRFCDRLSILLIARPNSSQICSIGLQSGDLAGCSILVKLPCWRKSRYTRSQWGVPLSPVGEHKRRFGTTVKSSPDVYRTTTSWEPKPYKPGTFAGSAHQVNDEPWASHPASKIGIWTHQRWHAANRTLSGSATYGPSPSGDGGCW